jgi:alginate O-acetyltransferase complex protein AlgI
VDSFFAQPNYLTGIEGWTGAILYAFQIYCDFSGYSDIAVGVGYLFGLELAINFRTPYVSANVTEFWRRWHITLSSWIRDYIYIPLGGSRKGTVRQYANLFAAMTISGIWHGAAWTFIAWGMYYGGLNIVQKVYEVVLGKLGLDGIRQTWPFRIVAVAIFFGITCIGWVMFRVTGMAPALSLIKRMLTVHSFVIPEYLRVYWWIALGLYALHVLEYLLFKHLDRVSAWWHKWVPSPARAVVYCAFLLLLVVFLKQKQSTFIYFQF